MPQKPGTKAKVWVGELFRWYVRRARHPLKQKIVGHFWQYFARPRFWIRYDQRHVLQVTLRDYVQREIFMTGYYDPEQVAWLKNNLTAEDVFWDMGANIGAMSLVAASCCRQVMAFEPAPATFQLLKQHIERNQVTNNTPLELALCEQTGTVELHISPGSNTGMTSILATDDTWECVSARSDTVDRLASEQKIPAPTVMKIDVEGTHRSENYTSQSVPQIYYFRGSQRHEPCHRRSSARRHSDFRRIQVAAPRQPARGKRRAR